MAPPVDLFTKRCCSYDTALISQQTISLIPAAARSITYSVPVPTVYLIYWLVILEQHPHSAFNVHNFSNILI